MPSALAARRGADGNRHSAERRAAPQTSVETSWLLSPAAGTWSCDILQMRRCEACGGADGSTRHAAAQKDFFDAAKQHSQLYVVVSPSCSAGIGCGAGVAGGVRYCGVSHELTEACRRSGTGRISMAGSSSPAAAYSSGSTPGSSTHVMSALLKHLQSHDEHTAREAAAAEAHAGSRQQSETGEHRSAKCNDNQIGRPLCLGHHDRHHCICVRLQSRVGSADGMAVGLVRRWTAAAPARHTAAEPVALDGAK